MDTKERMTCIQCGNTAKKDYADRLCGYCRSKVARATGTRNPVSRECRLCLGRIKVYYPDGLCGTCRDKRRSREGRKKAKIYVPIQTTIANIRPEDPNAQWWQDRIAKYAARAAANLPLFD